MRKSVCIAVVIMLAGLGAFYSGYRYVRIKAADPDYIKYQEEEAKPVSSAEKDDLDKVGNDSDKQGYLLKLEDNMLFIYELPEERLYEYFTVENNVQKKQLEQVIGAGMHFITIEELYGFLENYMS